MGQGKRHGEGCQACHGKRGKRTAEDANRGNSPDSECEDERESASIYAVGLARAEAQVDDNHLPEYDGELSQQDNNHNY